MIPWVWGAVFLFSFLVLISMFGISPNYALHLYMTPTHDAPLSYISAILTYFTVICGHASSQSTFQYSTVTPDKYNFFNLPVLRSPPVLESETRRLFLKLTIILHNFLSNTDLTHPFFYIYNHSITLA